MKNFIVKNIFFCLFLFLLIDSSILFAQDNANTPKPEVGIYERLGEFIPNDVILTDEYGQQVNLKSLINKPTVISLVYFRCPGICSPLLNGVSYVIDRVDLEPGKDFNLITISFDPREDHLMAAEKKENYLSNLNRKIPSDSWRFLTGDSINTKKIADALGFKFQRQGNDYMHGTSIMVVSPEGKIVRYLYGTEYLPFDFKMAITEATEEKVGPTISKLVKMCFSFDPEARKYVLNITRIAGGGILLLLGIFLGVLILKKRKPNLNS